MLLDYRKSTNNSFGRSADKILSELVHQEGNMLGKIERYEAKFGQSMEILLIDSL